MKVVLLSGSPRANGNTMAALKKCAAAIQKEGLETEIISLHDKNIQGCKACGACGKLGKCAVNDGLNEVIEKIREADGYIVGAPVYYGTARGDIMNAIQRISMVAGTNGKWLAGKVGGPVVVARRGGLTSTLQEMLMHFFISGVTVPGSTYWNILFGRAPGEVLDDTEGVETVETFAKNMAQLIKKIK
ncbi:MAG: flavodoxin family protein [Bacillota bacterium]|jgi:multimeric flavodoxin WrbA